MLVSPEGKCKGIHTEMRHMEQGEKYDNVEDGHCSLRVSAKQNCVAGVCSRRSFVGAMVVVAKRNRLSSTQHLPALLLPSSVSIFRLSQAPDTIQFSQFAVQEGTPLRRASHGAPAPHLGPKVG